MDEAYTGARVAVHECAELAIPLQQLGVEPGGVLAFAVTVQRVSDGQRIVVERHPAVQPIRLAAPTQGYAALHWRA